MKLYTTGWLVLALVLVMAGCKISSEYGNTRYRCDVSGQCPDGFACVNGYCETGGDAGVDPDSGVLPRTCGVVEMLVEDFESPEINQVRWGTWTDDAGLLAVVHRGGQLAFDIPIDIADVGSGYYSEGLYRFAGSRAFVEVIDAEAESDAGLYLMVQAPSSDQGRNRWYMEQQAGTLSFWERVDGNSRQLASVSYDPVAHRWWQIRAQDGVVYWETSADAVSWTTRAMSPSDLTDELVWISIETWVSNPQPEPRTFVVDNVNGGVDPGIGWCPAATLTDDFDDGVRMPEWSFWDWPDDATCLAHEQDGQLSFEFAAVTSYHECGYYTPSFFDLSNSTFVVQAPAADVGAMYVYLAVYAKNTDPQDHMEIWQGNGELGGHKRVQGTGDQTFAIPFDPIQHRWWRLRGENGTAYWETSADGNIWTTHASHSNPPLQLDEVELVLWSYSDEGGIANIGNGFDNMNLTPSP